MSSPLSKYSPERIQQLLALASPEERAEIDLLLLPSLEELESDWRIWLSTLFPQFVRGDLAFFHIEYWDWLWAALWAKRRGEPLPNAENAFMSVWPRGAGKSSMSRLAPIAEAALLGQGYCLYLGGSQDQANKHLTSIETLLTSERVRYYYPQLARPRVGNTDKNKAWNQKMLHTQSGYVLQGIGLDVGIRGANIDDMRVSLLIPDDIDDRSDTALQSEQKLDKFLHSVLPTKKAGTIFICSQNLVLETGVINRIVTGEVQALANARISGPHKRVENLVTEQQTINGRQRDIVISGDVTWPGNDSLERVQEDIDTVTLIVFMREYQHDLAVDRAGLVLSRWEDRVHVITESQFHSVFGYRAPPAHWNKYVGHDWAKTKSAHHANVCIKVAVSGQNEPLPGCLFLYDAMSFAEGTAADDVAVRILKSITPTVNVRGQEKDWDQVLRAELQRDNLDEFVASATDLITARRAVLAKLIPKIIAPQIKARHYRQFRMSHEMKDVRNVYRMIYGLPFSGTNPRREGGIEFLNHYLRVDMKRAHPFKDQMGWSQMYLIVPDEKEGYPLVLRPDTLHDSDLIRYQFKHWRYSVPHLTATGIVEHGPMKLSDDFGNALMMIFHDNQPMAQPLNYFEKVEELIPAENRLEKLLQPSTSLMGRKTMTPAAQMSYEMARGMARKKVRSRRQRFDDDLNPI